MESIKDKSAAATLSWGVIWPVFIFFLCSIVSVLDRQILTLMVDPVRRDLHITDVQIGILQGPSFAIFYTVIGLALGMMADRTSRKWLIVAGIFGWSLATLLGGYCTSFESLLLVRICVGVGEATLAPAAVSMISDMASPTNRGRLISVFLMGQSLGNGLSTLLVGWILGAGPSGQFGFIPMLGDLVPWRQAFVVSGLIGFVVVLLIMTIKEPARLTTSSGGVLGGSMRSVIAYFSANSRLMTPIYIGFAIYGIGYYGGAAWGVTMIIRHFGMTATEISHIFGPASIAGSFIGALCGGALADKAAYKGGNAAKLGLMSLLSLTFFPAALAVFAPSATVAIGMIVLSNIFFSISGVVLTSLIQDLVPSNMRGISMSLLTFCTTLVGFTSGPLLIALATEHLYGDPSLIGYSIATVIAPALILSSIMFRRGQYVSKHPE